ncbi:MAG TPA: DUF4239 domain-containing protein [Ignavibacteria bacterium]|nr:hypothetical protein [Bacteroidota bacterium]HRE09600.1 DUF4239 domain-containing protein [Ignavibacteria bacterium]HRF64381.1 DUF4239 domain-containing protein [Ignavibacteria bacterium]HRJ03894.1 DUF4239 domain-containing protein [Ignavibacteria bacterium]HRJ84350.1 DUF4239 domain-containing protein [Ignavibacteria bacterium]
MEFILDWHPVIAITVLSLFTVLVSYAGLKIVRKFYTEDVLRQNHEVGGFIFNAFGLIYAVLVAFVVFATWTEYDNSKKNVDQETIELADIFHNSKALPEPYRSQVIPLLRTYTEDVINSEWKQLEEGEPSLKARESFHVLWTFFTSLDRSLIKNEIAYQETLKHLNDAGEKRRMRIFDSSNNIPGIIWVVLLFGSVVTVLYTYFFYAKNITHQFVMTSALTVLNTLILYMILLLDNPFSGYMKIDHKPFDYVLQLLSAGM